MDIYHLQASPYQPSPVYQATRRLLRQYTPIPTYKWAPTMIFPMYIERTAGLDYPKLGFSKESVFYQPKLHWHSYN